MGRRRRARRLGRAAQAPATTRPQRPRPTNQTAPQASPTPRGRPLGWLDDIEESLGEGTGTVERSPFPEGTLLRRGDRGPQVEQLQQELADAGHTLSVDGIFGPGTEAAVREFQRDNELSPDGIVGPDTLAAFDATSPRPMARPEGLTGTAEAETPAVETETPAAETQSESESETETETETQSETETETETETESDIEVDTVMVIDAVSYIRTGPPEFARAEGVIPLGTNVRILRTDENTSGRTYAEVRWGDGDAERTAWTLGSNLQSPKSVDASLQADDPVPLEGLSGLTRQMGLIHNQYGSFLEERSNELSAQTGGSASVLQVESNGQSFAFDGKMIIRFEAHKFWTYWGSANPEQFGEYFAQGGWRGSSHQYRLDPEAELQAIHTGSQSDEWAALEKARELDDTAALKSISMGSGQVMGFNFELVGYETVQQMFEAMNGGVSSHLDAMFNFVESVDLCRVGLQNEDWVTFATGYNGTGQAQAYGAKLASARTAYDRALENRPPEA